MEASLVLLRADGSQREVPLRAGTALVGRESDAQIRIPASGVSRRHCEFEVRGSDIILRDLGSRNGTFVNGEKVVERALAAGDAIAIDEVVFVLRVDGSPARIDTAARERALPGGAGAGSDDSEFGLGGPSAGKSDPGDSSAAGFDFDDLLDDDDGPRL